MIKVLVSKQSNYPVGVTAIKKKLAEFLALKGIVSDAVVNVAIVSEKKMLEVQKKYFKEKNTSSHLGYQESGKKPHNVLSFVPSEAKGGFVYPPDGKVYLGEIIVCFPVAVLEAKEENVLIDTRVYELVEHGALHLLGFHH